ncbi:unnamed protein product [Hymenolepis diminuta]|uniref:MFS domain-containing protein n=1 Tax=Hymenolepis diminuta TaxID=6216 RepID=A0A3P6ZTC9_HYMDI|nr:unnamed protein product [Hymenolepis diminuta]
MFYIFTIFSSTFEGMDEAAREQWVQSKSAYVSTAMSLVSGIVGLFTIIPLGFVSDKYGRKVGLFIAYLGFAIESAMIASVMLFHLPLWVLIVATLPSSILGNGICGILTQIFVCITDLTEQKAEVLERRLSVAPVIEGELAPLHRRSRTSSILERSEPKSLSTVQSTMASERLSYIAMFEGVIGMTMAIVTMTIGPAISKFGFKFPGWFMLALVIVNLVLTVLMPNTKALWDTPTKKNSIIPKEIDVNSKKKLLSISSAGENQDSQNPVVALAEPKKKTNCCVALKHAFSFVTVPITIEIIANLLASMVALTDIPVLNLYFIGEPFGMSISQVGITLGIRTIGCSVVSGLFVVFNMFYLQPRLATPNIKHMKLKRAKNSSESTNDNIEDNVPGFTDAEIAAERHSKMLEARRIMLFGLGGLFFIMAVSKFLYGISSSFGKPTCLILLVSAIILNSFQFFGPIIRALLSGLVSCEVQGRLYALIGFGDSFGGFIGMTSLPALFASTVFMNAGFAFYMAALVLVVAFILNG